MKNDLLTLAGDLRKNATDAERLLWKHLRGKRFDGMKFRRQQQIGRYIVDFVCLERRVVVEVDGGQHAEGSEGALVKLLTHPPQTPPLKGGDE